VALTSYEDAIFLVTSNCSCHYWPGML